MLNGILSYYKNFFFKKNNNTIWITDWLLCPFLFKDELNFSLWQYKSISFFSKILYYIYNITINYRILKNSLYYESS